MTTDLIRQFNRGHQAAFTTIYDCYQPAIFYFVKKFIPDTAEAEDITAETFIKLWKRRENFDNERSIASFLHITARNASIDWLRSEKKEVHNRQNLIYLLSQDQYTEFQEDIKGEVLRLIKMEIDRLPLKTKQVLLMSYVEGKSNEEIAQLLNIRNQSVRNHKARALNLIRLAIIKNKWLITVMVIL
ncbi:MAG: sigma-70 family RNA polymerase sigma factor [Bacteroidetes bacterium]|jgi:RNA polymerase sigma-70 factor (family 1)|nr:MAG: sigma-70 family RNA polymerase sigma factor [Bacteroidota bacterium]